MEPIEGLFGPYIEQNFTTRSRRSERGDMIQYFHSRINAARVGKYKPLSMSAIAVKLCHCSLADLYYLKTTCLNAERRGNRSHRFCE
jgi:hypothetical protein